MTSYIVTIKHITNARYDTVYRNNQTQNSKCWDNVYRTQNSVRYREEYAYNSVFLKYLTKNSARHNSVYHNNKTQWSKR